LGERFVAAFSSKIARTVPSGSPVLYAIFRAPIPARWFSGTIEAERTYFPLFHSGSDRIAVD
jgi:hypothetical protein